MDLLWITLAVWFTYWNSIRKGFVSDDIDAIVNYDGKLLGWDYGRLTKWIFYRLFQKSPERNHFFSIFMHNVNCILVYLLLINYFSPQIALFTCILFAVHPVNSQSVAWISARGYLLGFFFCLLALHTITLGLPLALTLALFAVFFFLAVHGQFATLMTFPILILLGYYPYAVISLGIACGMGAGIIKEVIGIRAKTFKEQNMGLATKVHHRKFIVAVKTLAYYTQLCFIPKRLGLYHVFGYHYTKETEKEDKVFWLGFILLGIFLWMFFTGNLLVKFGVLWYLSYIFIFLNWITVHQFVSERYCYIPNIGLCLLLAGVLVDFPVAFALLVGLYAMRTMMHLDTYMNDVLFYQSNIWNFPNSEVAMANLGVTYMRHGLAGSAVDCWLIAERINPQYDVAQYNLSSVLKQKGDLQKAVEYLKKAVTSPMCHFQEQWANELKKLEHELEHVKASQELKNQIAEAEKDPAKKPYLDKMKAQLAELDSFHVKLEEERKQKLTLVQQEESTLELKKVQLSNVKNQLKPIPVDELVKMRDHNFNIIKSSFLNLLKGGQNAPTQGGVPPQRLEGGVNPSGNRPIQPPQSP